METIKKTLAIVGGVEVIATIIMKEIDELEDDTCGSPSGDNED